MLLRQEIFSILTSLSRFCIKRQHECISVGKNIKVGQHSSGGRPWGERAHSSHRAQGEQNRRIQCPASSYITQGRARKQLMLFASGVQCCQFHWAPPCCQPRRVWHCLHEVPRVTATLTSRAQGISHQPNRLSTVMVWVEHDIDFGS